MEALLLLLQPHPRSLPVQLVPGMRIARHLPPAACKPTYVRSKTVSAGPARRKQNFTACSGHPMMPTRSPSGAITQMPPGPVQYTRPMLSTFKPSGMPGSAPSFISAKMLRPTMLPAASSLIPWMYCDERVFATYIVRSSGDSASPFGYSQCREHAQAAVRRQTIDAHAIPEIVVAVRAGALALVIGTALVRVREIQAAIRVADHIVGAVKRPPL